MTTHAFGPWSSREKGEVKKLACHKGGQIKECLDATARAFAAPPLSKGLSCDCLIVGWRPVRGCCQPEKGVEEEKRGEANAMIFLASCWIVQSPPNHRQAPRGNDRPRSCLCHLGCAWRVLTGVEGKALSAYVHQCLPPPLLEEATLPACVRHRGVRGRASSDGPSRWTGCVKRSVHNTKGNYCGNAILLPLAVLRGRGAL